MTQPAIAQKGYIQNHEIKVATCKKYTAGQSLVSFPSCVRGEKVACSLFSFQKHGQKVGGGINSTR